MCVSSLKMKYIVCFGGQESKIEKYGGRGSDVVVAGTLSWEYGLDHTSTQHRNRWSW